MAFYTESKLDVDIWNLFCFSEGEGSILVLAALVKPIQFHTTICVGSLDRW
jgi:hypothetical protein